MKTKFFLLSLLVLPFMACAQGNDSTPAEARLLNPCELFTKEEVGQILGAEVKEGSLGTEIPMLGQSECNWDLVDPVDEQDGKIWLRSLQLVLIQEKGMDAEVRKNGTSAVSQFEAFRANLTGTTTDLDGLGDRAFRSGVGLHLLKGKVYVQLYTANQVAVSFGALEPEELAKAQEAARAFGEKIVDKI